MELPSIKSYLDDSLEEVVNVFKQKLDQKGITNSGYLADSFETTIDDDGLTISYAMYGDAIDMGRKAGKFPPIKPIEEWVKRRGIKAPKQTTQQTAFAIAKSIEKKGIKPKPFIQPALDDVVNNVLIPQIENDLPPLLADMLIDEFNKINK